MIEPLNKYFLEELEFENDQLTILDLGSGNFLGNLLLYKGQRIEEYTAVDNKNICTSINKDELNENFPNITKNQIEKIYDELIDNCNSYTYYELVANKFEISSKLDKALYYSNFCYVKMDVVNFVESNVNDKKYDLIILSKIMAHLDFDEDKLGIPKFLKSVSKLIKKNGHIFIRLNSKGYEPNPNHSHCSIKRSFNMESINLFKEEFQIVEEPKLLKENSTDIDDRPKCYSEIVFTVKLKE